jgi:chorismate mutase/prephenate dehydratase
MEIETLREKIDEIDNQICRLFEKRMGAVGQIAEYKRANRLPVADRMREREIISRLTEHMDDEMASYTKIMFTTLFDLSRSYQNRSIIKDSPLAARIERALAETPECFPSNATVACQGIEGAYSQIACEKLFSRPSIMYMNSFQGVFQAVDKNLCRYGILPIENSVHGSVTQVYDLMEKYNFHIVRAIKLQVNHMLLAKNEADISKIKEIFSQEQALGQCSEFLSKLPGVKITVCANTAVAAKLVTDSPRTDIAAISSKSCAELYGLVPICDKIQNSDNNYTRFICISKQLEIYPGADKTSLMFTLPHRPGSLYNIIARFAALGLNLTKLESRPIPGRDFEFMFYFDMDASIYSKEVISLLSELDSSPEKFVFLGSYLEI